MGKHQFQEADQSSKVVGVKFTIGSSQLIRQASHLEVRSKLLYDTGGPVKWTPAQYGVLDTRLGTSQKGIDCATCGMNVTDCAGHFGFIELEYPVFHVGFFRLIIQVLQCICKRCSSTLLSDEQKAAFMKQVRSPQLDYIRRKALQKKIVAASKKITYCRNCGFSNGVVKKAVGSVLKIVHGEPIADPRDEERHDLQLIPYRRAMVEHRELANLIETAKFNLLDPLKVHELFIKIKAADIPLIMVGADLGKHPMNMLLTRLPVPPVCVRPSTLSDLKGDSNEDDLTMKLTEIMLINEALQKHKENGGPIKTVTETWDHLQIQCALYINSELNGLPIDMQPKKFLRSFAQRLKGKQGRFRGNLSGKRVDFTGRTVISPDPNLRVDEVGIPVQVAKLLTFPEIVNSSNIEALRRLVLNGEAIYPGANHIIDHRNDRKISLRYVNRERVAKYIHPGDIVERHLVDGDIVLFNRQPSLHKISIMAHKVRVMPYRTFRLNECVCTPYNADFDGDEMNLHLPQTYEAKAEASTLMGVKSNLVTPRSGDPMVSPIQDFITASYLMTHKETFLTRREVYRLASSLMDVKTRSRIRLPPPAIRRPAELWTGKQLMELVISPFEGSRVDVCLTTKRKNVESEKDGLAAEDGYVRILHNQLLCGNMDKAMVGSGSKTNVFFVLLRDFGEDEAAEAMWRLARLSPAFLSNRGFSIGIGDVKPTSELLRTKHSVITKGYAECDVFSRVREGDSDVVVEAKIRNELSRIREDLGKACQRSLAPSNAPLTMAVCGSKGSFINISQMIACVGQQVISGKRPSDGFEGGVQNRSLPHFARGDQGPRSKGFVENSFYTGLTPTEFFFHAMAGREGLVDTAVKTAETGYMQRRLVKALEDLAVAYDNTVRTSTGEVVQFVFGEDGLDPSCMEGKGGELLSLPHILDLTRPVGGAQEGADFSDYRDLKSHVEEEVARVQQNAQIPGERFVNNVHKFLLERVPTNERYLALSDHCRKHATSAASTRARCPSCKDVKRSHLNLVRANCVSKAHASKFINHCVAKYRRAMEEPGSAVGAIAATSIGEPSTQMTLKTFHFAGVASMNITQGVPRIKEIINSVRNLSTPVITVQLERGNDKELARVVKAKIEKTTLGEISEFVEQHFDEDDAFVRVRLSPAHISNLKLTEVNLDTIETSIRRFKFPFAVKVGKVRVEDERTLRVWPEDPDNPSSASRAAALKKQSVSKTLALHSLKYNLPQVVIKGLRSVTECIIHEENNRCGLLVNGTEFGAVLAIPGVDGRKTQFNGAAAVAEVLGVEAARTVVINEIEMTMRNHGIELDRRHVMLLADLMTYRGDVLGITRNGLAKMKESVLLMASFEQTTDHLYEAAFFAETDAIIGVSESIIMGVQMPIGTGMFKLLHSHKSNASRSGAPQREVVIGSKEMNVRM